jgi:acyl carrier protein
VSTFQRVRRLLAEVLRIEESIVTPNSSIAHLFDRYSGDSLDRVELVMALEEAFDLEVTDEEAAAWEALLPTVTVQQLVEFIDRKRSR